MVTSLVMRFARPVGVLELVDSEENDVDAEARELLAGMAGPFRRC